MGEVVFESEVVKVAGTPQDTFWAQTFSEKPTDPEKLSLRGQLFLVILVKSSQNPAEIGHKFWINLTSAFYGQAAGDVLSTLQEAAKSALGKLSTEASFEELSFVAASLWGKILYLVVSGRGEAGLVRSGKFALILPASTQNLEVTSASGFLQNGDLIFLATEPFFQIFGKLEKFQEFKIPDIEEELASQIGQSEEAYLIAAQVLKIKEAPLPTPEEVVIFTEASPERISFFRFKILANFFNLLRQQILKIWPKFFYFFSQTSKLIIKFLPKRAIYLTSNRREFLRKNFFTLLLSILILILIGSLAAGIWQRQRRENFKKFGEYFNLAQNYYDEAQAISPLNRLKARELLDQAQADLSLAKKLKFEKEKVAELEQKINQENLKSLKLVKIENPSLVFDLTLVKLQTTISEIEKLQDIFAFDRLNLNLFSVQIDRKTGQITAGGADFSGFTNFTLTQNFAYFLKLDDGIYQFDLSSKVSKKVIEKDANWGEILDLTNFAGNLYFLDGAAGQIWKYIPTADGFSSIRGFLQEAGKADFSGASFAIDGFIWVLTSGGRLYQLSPAEAKLVEISGLDKPLSPKTILRTNADAENLYIGDLGNARILVLSKTGLYLAQYSSGVFAQMSDFSVDEISGKIYFATGSKIFQFDLVK